MVTNLRDTANTWVLQPDGSYIHRSVEASELISSHQYFMENPSLFAGPRWRRQGKGKGKNKSKGRKARGRRR